MSITDDRNSTRLGRLLKRMAKLGDTVRLGLTGPRRCHVVSMFQLEWNIQERVHVPSPNGGGLLRAWMGPGKTGHGIRVPAIDPQLECPNKE